MSSQIQCSICNIKHKADSKNFPVARRELRYIVAEKTIRPVIVGYVCRWCISKKIKKEENNRRVKQQKIQVKEIKPQKKNIIKKILNVFRYKRIP